MSAKARTKSAFFCQDCGHEEPKWLGRCPGCNAWNTFAEEPTAKAGSGRDGNGFVTLTSEKPLSLAEISTAKTPRYSTGVGELDRVLGGGVVPGTLVLLGGDPGIGKSTLILETIDKLAQNNISVLYVTGEESPEQIKLRAERLDITSNVKIVAENSLDRVLKHADALKPQVLVVDSIQTAFLEHIQSAPGSVSQVRECAGKLLYFAKSSRTSVIIIGHVTKEGAIAGPRVLEHMVDVVLYFEGENTGQFRLLRTIKNRYGSTNEIGVFEMTSRGLCEVVNPSQIFLGDKREKIGSCVVATVEGTRAILVEIQALVSPSGLAMPRRAAIGLDPNRLALIIAVCEKLGGIKLYNQDVYASVTGGLKLTEPAADLAVLLSLTSSFRDRPLSGHLAAIGEIGLCGEIRPVAHLDKRLAEAVKLGYRNIVIPAGNKLRPDVPAGVKITAASGVGEALAGLE